MAIPYAAIEAASTWLVNADLAAKACQATNLPYWLFCAVLDKESKGKNVWGHDKGGALSGYERPVTEEGFQIFWWLLDGGQLDTAGNTVKVHSNGVGPCQITYRGFLQEMLAEDLRPWDPADNMLKGAQILRQYLTDAPRKLTTEQRIKAVGKRWNGADSYGTDLWRVARVWHGRVGSADFPSFRV